MSTVATLDDGRASADGGVRDLYAGQWAPMVRLAWLFVHDDLLAEEIAQDAFVAVHRRWDRLRDPDRAVGYLRRSVVNGARSALRHRGVEERYRHSLTSGLRREGGAASVEEAAIANETRDELFRALQSLPSRQREVLTMRYYLDLDEAGIAEALGIARGSVKAHASRGLASLRARVGGVR